MSRNLTITIEPDWKGQLAKNAKQAFRGKKLGEKLSFASPELFFSKLTANRWALVNALQGSGEMGVREVARKVERDVRRVHDDLQVLLEIGLIEKTAEGKVLCPYADIHMDMHMRAA